MGEKVSPHFAPWWGEISPTLTISPQKVGGNKHPCSVFQTISTPILEENRQSATENRTFFYIHSIYISRTLTNDFSIFQRFRPILIFFRYCISGMISPFTNFGGKRSTFEIFDFLHFSFSPKSLFGSCHKISSVSGFLVFFFP